MNTISQTSMVHVAMDGQALYKSSNIRNTNAQTSQQFEFKAITPTGAQAAQDIEQNIQELEADSQQLQKLSEIVTGRKLQFSVNKEIGSVVVSVVDTNTNQVLKQIPSEDMQKLKARIRKAIGTLFDKVV